MSAMYVLGVLTGIVLYRLVKWWIKAHFGGTR